MSSIKKRVVWSEIDEIFLLEQWADRAADLRRTKRNKHIYADISLKMEGIFSAQDVYIKIRNMTQRYRHEKKNVGPSGGSPSIWKHFMAVHQIVSGNAVNNADIFESFSLDTAINESFQSVACSSPPSTSAPPTPSPSPSPSIMPPHSPSPDPVSRGSSASTSGRKRNNSGEVIRIMQENTEILRSVMEDTKVLTTEVIAAIREQNDTSREFLALMKTLIEKM